MKAIIAAAGRGRRLMPYTKDKPKSLVSIGDKRLIEYTLENLFSCGIKDVVMIVGYCSQKFIDIIGNNYKGCNIKYVINERYATTDNMTSLWMAKDDIGEGFIFINADVLFERELLQRLVDSSYRNVCVVDDQVELSPSFIKVGLDGDKVEAIERGLEGGSARAIGVYKFSPEGGKAYFSKIQSFLGNKDSKLQIEPAINLFSKENDLFVLRTNGLFWEEIDDEKDLNNAKENVDKLLRPQ